MPPKLPKIFKQPVDVDRVNLDVIKTWLETKLDGLVPNDDILVDYTFELVQNKDISYIHQQLVEFLGEEESVEFCRELWTLMISAQEAKDGVPPLLVKRTNYNRSDTREEGGDRENGQEYRNRGGNRRDERKERNERGDERRDGLRDGLRDRRHTEYRGYNRTSGGRPRGSSGGFRGPRGRAQRDRSPSR